MTGNVKTKNGIVSGKPGYMTDCTVFLGIPYAKPPIGELRYQAPQKAENWEGIKECVSFPAACIQPKQDKDFLISQGPIPRSSAA